MKYSAKVTFFAAILSFVFTTSALARKEMDRQGVAPGTHSSSAGEVKLKNNRYLAPYLPSDIRSVNESSVVICDEQGRPTRPTSGRNDVHGRCYSYIDSNGEKYTIRFESVGGYEGARILKHKGGSTVLHAHFDQSKRPIYVSQEASRFAQANPLPQQAMHDCGSLNILEKVKCEINNKAALGIGVKIK